MSIARICRLGALLVLSAVPGTLLFSPKQPQTRAAERPGKNYAFLVACQGYDKNELKPLRYTQNDIVDLSEALREAGWDRDNIVLMHDGKGQDRDLLPEAKKIRRKLRQLLAEVRPADTLVVAFAGHGIQFKGEGRAYFCPVDAELKDRSTLIGLDELYKSLKGCKARRKLLLVDACRNDPQSALARSREEVSLEKFAGVQKEPVPEGIVALFSCSAGQQSFEDPALKHGVFFHHVLRGLNGAAADRSGKVSFSALADYVSEQTPRYVRLTLKLREAQVPEQKNEFSGVWVLRQETIDEAAQRRAVAAVRRLNGQVIVDEAHFARPVTKISFASGDLTDSWLPNLKGLVRLHHLALCHSAISDEGMTNLKGLSQLDYLDLTGTTIGDAGLAHLKELRQLRSLYLWRTRVSGRGLAHLKGLPRLRFISLSHAPVTDDGLAAVTGLKQLTFIHLSYTKVTDAGLAHVAGLRELIWLDLDGTKVTDDGLKHLAALHKLTFLSLRETGVTDEGVGRLKRVLPKVAIKR